MVQHGKIRLLLSVVFTVNFVLSAAAPEIQRWGASPNQRKTLQFLQGDVIQRFTRNTQDSGSSEKVANLVPETIKLLNEGHERIMLHPKKEYVMIVGKAGTGKSTLALLLTGDNSKLIAVDDDGEFYIKEKEPEVPRIGTETSVSQTIFPEAHFDKDTGVVYYDCPGFADSRKAQPHIEIANAMFMKKVADHADKLKIIITVNHFALKRTADRNDFKDTIKSATKLLLNTKKYIPGVGMVVTKVESRTSDEKVIEGIAAFLERFKKSLSATTDAENLEASMALMNGLLVTDEAGRYPRISIIRTPSEEGPLSEDKPIQKNKADFKRMVSQLQFVNHAKNDIGYVISDDMLLVTRDVHDTIQSQVTKNVQKWATSFERHFQNQVAELQKFTNCPNCSASGEIWRFKQNWAVLLDFGSKHINFNSLEDDVLGTMSKTVPLIEEALLEKLDSDAATLNFLAEVDKRINSSDWSELKIVLERTGLKMIENLKESHRSSVSQAGGLFKELSIRFEDHVKKQLKQILSADAGSSKDRAIKGAKQNLIIIKNLTDSGITEKKADLGFFIQFMQKSDLPNNKGQSQLRGINTFLQLLKGLDEEMFPSIQHSKLMETVSNTADSLKNFVSTGDFYMRGKAMIVASLDQVSHILKNHYADQFAVNDYSSWSNMKTAVESLLNGVKKSRGSTQAATGIWMDLHRAWNLALEELKRLKLHEPVLGNAAEIKTIIDTMQLGKIMVDHLPEEPHIVAIHVWQPLENFLQNFLETLKEAPEREYNPTTKDLVIRGNVISMQDIVHRLQREWKNTGTIKSLVITAKHTVFMDASVVGSQISPSGLNLVILSPKWWVSEPHINLDGIPGATPSSWNKSPGQSGSPGLPGGNAGNFFGVGQKFMGQGLQVSVDGGQGGRGEDGQPGANGAEGPMASVYEGWKSQSECVGHQTKVFGKVTYDQVRIHSRYYGYDCKCDMHGWVEFYGARGQPGKTGGDGGKGGLGGYGGYSTVVDFSSEARVKQDQGSRGQRGSGGKGGQGGKGGRKGATKFFKIFTEITSYWRDKCSRNLGFHCDFEDDCTYYNQIITPSNVYESGGANGRSDLVTSGLQDPTSQKYEVRDNLRHYKNLQEEARQLMDSTSDTKLAYQPLLSQLLRQNLV